MPAQKKQLSKPTEPEAFDVPTSAQIIGSSARVIWDEVKNRKIAHFRIGKRVLISRIAINEYISRNTIPAIDGKAIARELLE